MLLIPPVDPSAVLALEPEGRLLATVNLGNLSRILDPGQRLQRGRSMH